MNDIERYALAILIVVGLSEFIPEAVNTVLALILIGIVLMQYPKFSGLVSEIGKLGK